MNDRASRFLWAEGDVLVEDAQSKSLLTLVGRKYNENHDDRGRFASSDTASDGEPIRVSKDIEGTQTFAKLVDAVRDSDAHGSYQSPQESKQTEFGKFAANLPGNQDPALVMMAQEKGFDAQPKLVSGEEVDKLVAAGAPDLWRGVAGYNRAEDQPRFNGSEAADALLHGDYYAGKGTYGDGIYFIASSDTDKVERFPSTSAREGAAVNFAGGYAGNDGAVVHATLPPDAKIADYNEIHNEATSHYNEVMAQSPEEKDPHDEAVRHVLFDDGRYALAKGYDAIKVPSTETGTSPFYVILNRGALVAEDKIYPVKMSSDFVITAPELKDRVRQGQPE